MAAINVIFDGPPDHESGRFVEVEDDQGRSIRVGDWSQRTNGLWALRIEALPGEDLRCDFDCSICRDDD